MPCGMLSSILGLYPLENSSTSSVVTTKSVSRQCPMSPDGTKASSLRSIVLRCRLAGSPSPQTVKANSLFGLLVALSGWRRKLLPIESSPVLASPLTCPGPTHAPCLVSLSAAFFYRRAFAFLVLSRNLGLKRHSLSLQNPRITVTWN